MARVRRESWRSFWAWVSESLGRFGVAGSVVLVVFWSCVEKD